MRIIVFLLFAVALAEVIPFNEDAIDKIFKDKASALFLFVPDQQSQAQAIEIFKLYDATNPGFVLTLSSKNDGTNLFERLAEYLGVDVSAGPRVLFMNDKSQKFIFPHSEFTVESLANFAEKIQKGEFSPFLKSAEIPKDNNGAVKIVVGKNFKQIVMNSEKEVLAKFYAPWCGHCKELEPHYEEAARRLSNNPNILLIKIDATENQIEGVQIEGFPTLFFFPKDKSQKPIDYDGKRTADGIVEWIKKETKYDWIEPLEAQIVVETEQGQEQEGQEGEEGDEQQQGEGEEGDEGQQDQQIKAAEQL